MRILFFVSFEDGILICSNYIEHLEQHMNPKNANSFHCEVCNFKCSKQSNYNTHILTAKHKNRINRTEIMPNNAESNTRNDSIQYVCECGKTYSARNSLWYHKKKCTYQEDQNHSKDTTTSDGNILDALIRQQEIHKEESAELKKMLIQQQEQMKEQQEQHNKQIQELIPQLQQVTNINNNNCNNKFNLNFFLNEQCKDAISIQHFIENLNIGIRELEHMGDVGYVKGMMSIFSETLGKMDIYKRPLHCTDLKRDTLYIKQGDTWTKDTEDKTELKKIVETVKCRNYRSLRLWEREHPEAFECDTQDNIDYMRISSESLGGFNSSDAIKLNKIIKHVVKEVYVK